MNPAFACEKWFKALNIEKKKDCESICRTSQVDMSSYMCTNQCDILCKGSLKNEAKNYYGLTDDEIKFCKENTIKCALAYKQSWIAEKTCLEIYPYSATNDESDACRHYVWAILLCRELNLNDAEIVLNAHENNEIEPKNQKAMDLANNRLALINYQKNSKTFQDFEGIKKSFIQEMKNNKFIVIEPKYSSSKGIP